MIFIGRIFSMKCAQCCLYKQRLDSPVCCVIVFIVSVMQICTHPDKSFSPVIVSQWVILPDPGPPTVLFMGKLENN